MAKLKYKRILLKLSGEALAGGKGFGFDFDTVSRFADELQGVIDTGASVGHVIGGGNIIRGSQLATMGLDRVSADYMGMLGTVINALALQDALEKAGVHTRVMSALEMNQVAEPFIRRRALRHLEKGRVTVFAAGTGNPYFSTDTAATLRAMEIKADAILKATKVEGIYDSDPMINSGATKFEQITYLDFIARGLKVMDTTSISLSKDNKLPIIVFKLGTHGNIKRVVQGENVGTLVTA